MSAAAVESPALRARGGAIATSRLRPIVEQFVAEREITDDSLARRIYKVLHEADIVSFDFADRLLVDMDAAQEWHAELADVYEFTGPRVREPGGTPRFLAPAKVAAAHKLYAAGMSMEELGRRLWQQYGYASPDSCRFGLRRAFVFLGYPVRTKSEARQLLFKDQPCPGCGCAREKRTPRCPSCRHRHSKRRLAGLSYVSGLNCKGCGCDYHDRTRSCGTCAQRHWRWKQSGLPYVKPSSRSCCGRCGVHVDERTRGCRTCKRRHAARRERSGPAISASLACGATLVKPTERQHRHDVTARSDKQEVSR